MKVFNLNEILKNAILLGLWAECVASHSDIDFGYLSDYIRCASNVLKCLRRYPNNN